MATYPGHVPDAGGANAFRLSQINVLRGLAARWAAQAASGGAAAGSQPDPPGGDDDDD